MLHIENNDVRKLLYQGCFGLEKESLRITPEGFLSHTPHPFPDDPHIVRDFCENQTEINTSVHHSAEGVVRELSERTEQIQKTLAELPEAELLWPFSNPPYIRSEEDIPIAQFKGAESGNTAYRNYLSDRYGRYVMTLSGIHFNYSFSEELLRAEFACRYDTDFANFRDQFYLELAEKAARFGWIVTAVTAASPVADRSFLEKGLFGGSFFTGMSPSDAVNPVTGISLSRSSDTATLHPMQTESKPMWTTDILLLPGNSITPSGSSRPARTVCQV